TALFDRPAFSNVISHGIVLGSDGQKMSKSLRNYPDVSEVFDRDGSDAMRWFLMSSPVIRGGNLVVTEEGIREGVRQFLLPIWSTTYFFTLYANASGKTAELSTGSADVLDRYLLAKTRSMVEALQNDLESLDSTTGALRLRDFADVLTNWYVRRSRDRFWEGDQDAVNTLFTVLETVLRAAAPLAPLVSEHLWKNLTGGRSVHLEDWPDVTGFPADEALVTAMDGVREVASSGLALRKATSRRVRLPLAALTVVTSDPAALEPFAGIIGDELNVKQVVLEALEEDSLERFGITRTLRVNARAAGPRIGKQVQAAIKASKSGDWSADGGQVVAGGIALEPHEYELDLAASDPAAAIGFLSSGGFVLLDTATTPELEAEGLARDVIRAVQQARKEADLDVSDRILLSLGSDDEGRMAIERHRDLIAAETLAVDVTIGVAIGGVPVGDGSSVVIGVVKA
ncbi:MAG: DUF5915 domain-containing protein, partial [Microbacteriaceae bacterium]